jgi:anhydro-N-acetylmuramic acid kinase
MKAHPWFRRRLPASCGREEFGEVFVDRLIRTYRKIKAADLIATFYALTAWSVARALQQLPSLSPTTLYVAGGGAHNVPLVNSLRKRLDPLPVCSVADLGCDPDALEAISFAVLGYLCVRGIPVDLRHATGAARPALLGRISQP